MQLDLIEKDELAGLRMFDYCGRKLPNAQAVIVLPVKLYGSPAAVVFHLGAIVGLKKPLPANIQSIREVADIHQAFALKSLTNARLQLTVNLPAIDDRRFTTGLRS